MSGPRERTKVAMPVQTSAPTAPNASTAPSRCAISDTDGTGNDPASTIEQTVTMTSAATRRAVVVTTAATAREA